jgi:transcriptional regulator with XRE-family HTH domain
MDRGRAFKEWLWSIYKAGDYESQRAFARAVGSDIATISRMMDFDNPARPSADFILKMHKLTGVSAGALLELAYPDQVDRAEAGLSSLVLAEMIEQLPDDLRAAVYAIVRGSANRRGAQH